MSVNFASHATNNFFEAYLSAYKHWLVKKTLTPNTLRAYFSRIKNFLLFLQYCGLYQQPFTHVQELEEAARLYTTFLKNCKTKITSVNACINALNNFSHFLGFSPIQIERERCLIQSPKVLSQEQQANFLAALEQQRSGRDRALALVLFNSGLRIGDIARLNVGNIGCIGSGGQQTVVICLNNGGQVQLSKSTGKMLLQWIEERKQYQGSERTSALWLTRQGQQLTISGISFVIKRIGWQAGLIISAEMLRRTWLVNLARELVGKKDTLASRFGAHVSQAAIGRTGLLTGVDPAISL